MADQRSKLESYKTQAGRCSTQLQHASTRDEALNLAVGAAEFWMKALNLATPEEKRELKEKCRDALDVADTIKNGADWTPPVAQNKGPIAGATSPAIDEVCEKPSRSAAPLPPSPTSIPPQGGPLSAPNVASQGRHHVATVYGVAHQPTHESYSPVLEYGQAVPCPATRIHRLKEPVSTRQRTTKESIILLRSSVVNGFKFPPWDSDPVSADFALENGSEKFIDSKDLRLSTFQQQTFQGWLRAEDALPPPTLIDGQVRTGPCMHSDRPIDLVQDAATDCSVVASLCAGVERRKRGHERILSDKIWPREQASRGPVLSPNGKYVVRLNFNGCWRKVVIDDRLPVSKTKRQIHVIDRSNPSLLWPALLEKAYLKVRGGYDFPGSNSCSDLWTMTGWIPEEIYLQEAEIVPDQLWKRVYNGFHYGDVLVTLGTGKMTSRQERDLGLESQHSYVVLDLRETESGRHLLVKNPWSQGRGWRGFPLPMLAEGSPVHDRMPMAKEYPATFWIGLDKVIQHYERLYLNWNPGLFNYRQDIHFEWAIKSNKEACPCIANQPQFSFSLKGSDLVFLLLSRHFRGGPDSVMKECDAFNDGRLRRDGSIEDSDRGYMSVFVCRSNGEQIYVKNTHEECTPYVSTPQCLLRFQAEANQTYTVVIDQEDFPASTYFFSLCAFSNSAMTLDPAAQKYPIQKMEAGAWTKHTAGGATQSPRYFQNPQYTLEVRRPSSLAILLSSPSAGNPLNVKLTVGNGRRMYKLQSRDVVADSGDYQTGCALAEARDLQPGFYTVICSLFEAGTTGEYRLRVDSTQDFTLRMIARDGAGLLSTTLAPAIFGPAVHKIAARLQPRRNASFTIVSRFERATQPQSHTDLGVLARSPLRLSVELGRGPERRSLMVSEGGEYSTTAIVRSESFHLEPAMLNYGDMWLVLERLLGSGGPVEECFDVEVLTDMPEAFSIGAWREWDD